MCRFPRRGAAASPDPDLRRCPSYAGALALWTIEELKRHAREELFVLASVGLVGYLFQCSRVAMELGSTLSSCCFDVELCTLPGISRGRQGFGATNRVVDGGGNMCCNMCPAAFFCQKCCPLIGWRHTTPIDHSQPVLPGHVSGRSSVCVEKAGTLDRSNTPPPPPGTSSTCR